MKTRSLAALAVVLLILVVAGIALLYAARPQVLDAVVYTPPTLAPATTAATGAQLHWSQPVVIPDRGSIFDVVKWRDGYVGAADAVVENQHVGAIFVSPNGLDWRRASTFVANPMLVATQSRLLAFVARDSPPSIEAWASTDGATWQRDDRLALTGATFARVLARDNTLVAVGSDQTGRTTRMWRSVDGAAWSSTDVPSAKAIVRSLVSVSDGFLAVGREGEPDSSSGGVGSPGVGRPAAWWSADGRAWTSARVEGSEAPGAQLSDVFRVTNGYLAVGSDTTTNNGNPRSALLWSSADARDWKLIGAPAHWGRAGANGRALVVFGAADFGTVALAAWMTPDGRTWSKLSFTGDVTDVPAFEPAVGQSSRVDGVFALPDGIAVIGQRTGQMIAWFCEMQ